VLEDNGRGRQKVEVEQVAAWRFLKFSGSFATRLFVHQDKRHGTVRNSSTRKEVDVDPLSRCILSTP
jgi:hypothetical protein